MRLGEDGPVVLEAAPYRPVRCLCGNDCFGLRGATPQSHVTVRLDNGQTWVVPRRWIVKSAPPLPPSPLTITTIGISSTCTIRWR